MKKRRRIYIYITRRFIYKKVVSSSGPAAGSALGLVVLSVTSQLLCEDELNRD